MFLTTLIAFTGFAGDASAETQYIPIRTPGWHFIALQVQPAADDPLSVFGSDYYDRIWTYDPVGQWYHYSPVTFRFNDLTRIDALRGYWIHATAEAPGLCADGSPGCIRVEGERPTMQELSDPGWHAIGILGPPGSVGDAFPDLEELTLTQTIAEVWRYTAGGFSRITNFGSCSGETCLKEGEAYWVRTTSRLVHGRQFSVSRQCVVLAAGASTAGVDVSYRGLGVGVGQLRVKNVCVDDGTVRCEGPLARCCSMDRARSCSSDADCAQSASGLNLLGASSTVVDGVSIPEPSRVGARAGGPDAAPECPAACAPQDRACADLCFNNASAGTYRFYVALDEQEALQLGGAATGGFSTCKKPYATLVIDAAGVSAATAGQAASAITTPMRRVINIAVQPPILRGDYVGRLAYRGGTGGDVPLRLLIDGCITENGATNCDTRRVTAVINPTLLGSASNGIDDDTDGDLDEDDEDGNVIPTRRALSFPRQMILHGTMSADERYVRLAGTGAVPDLVFARSGKPDAGIGSLFRGAERELVLEGRRADEESFSGLFADRYTGEGLGDSRVIVAEGRFEMSRMVRPECVARDTLRQSGDRAIRTIRLGVQCRDDADCPMRCTYANQPQAQGAGLPCDVDSDCLGAGAQCTAFTCGFYEMTDSSAAALEHVDATVALAAPIGRRVQLEVIGAGVPLTRIATIDATGTSSLSLEDLPCGDYRIVVRSAGCEPREVSVTLCPGKTITVPPLTCSGPVPTAPMWSPPVMRHATCSGGSSAGEPCGSSEHCPGGSCVVRSALQFRGNTQLAAPACEVIISGGARFARCASPVERQLHVAGLAMTDAAGDHLVGGTSVDGDFTHVLSQFQPEYAEALRTGLLAALYQ